MDRPGGYIDPYRLRRQGYVDVLDILRKFKKERKVAVGKYAALAIEHGLLTQGSYKWVRDVV